MKTLVELTPNIEKQVLKDIRNIRKNLARIHKVKPWVILFDPTIEDMVRKKPKTMEDFEKLTGVNKKKAEMYGLPFIEYFVEKSKDIT